MKRIMFVDDEPNVLKGLRLMLQSMAKQWEMVFIESPEQALELMEREAPFDIVVSDIRMAGMDGIEFLGRVKEQYPNTTRVAFTGTLDAKNFVRISAVAHNYLSKPCDADELKRVVTRALSLRERMQSNALKRAVHDISQLPSLPEVYQEMMAEFQSEEPSVKKVGEIIQKDPGMTANILKTVNSAQIGLRHSVSSPVQAASLLGLETLKSLVLMVGAFSPARKKPTPPGFAVEALWEHSLTVGRHAKIIAQNETKERQIVDDAFSAGLLHDMGQVILATEMRQAFGEALAAAEKEKVPLSVVERRFVGTTHGELAGYVLALWQLPDPLVEAVTFHDCPRDFPVRAFGPLTAVHVATNLRYDDQSTTADPDITPDMLYLSELDLAGRLEKWQELCLHESP